MKHIFIIICCACVGISTYAQQNSKIYQGQVLDAKTQEAIPFVNFVDENTQFGFSADEYGEFQMNIPEEIMEFQLSVLGYSDTIIAYQKAYQTIYLTNTGELLNVVQVEEETTRNLSKLNPINTESLGRGEITRAACCNLGEAFETNPTVDVGFSDAVSGSKRIKLLGLDSRYALVSRDFVPGPRGILATKGFDLIPGPWLNSIQLAKGTGSLVNSHESITGQINVELRNPIKDQSLYLEQYANANGRYETNFYKGFKLSDHVKYGLFGHYSTRDKVSDMNEDLFSDLPTGNQINILNSIKLHNYEKLEGMLSVQYIKDSKQGGQLGKLGRNLNATPWLYNSDIEATHVWAKLGYVIDPENGTSFGSQYAINNTEWTGNYGSREFTFKENTAYVNLLFQTNLNSEGHSIRTGITGQYTNLEQRFTSDYRAKNEFFEYGALAEYSIEDDLFSLIGGVRLDHVPGNGFMLFPRLHLRKILDEQSVFRIAVGRGARLPNYIADQTQFMASNRTFIYSQSKLEPEVAWNAGTSLSRNFELNFKPGRLSAEVYYSAFTRAFIADVDNSPQTVNFIWQDNGRSAVNIQFEASYEPIFDLSLTGAYRYTQALQMNLNGDIETPFVSPHTFFGTISYTGIDQFQFDITSVSRSPQRLPDTRSNPEQFRKEQFSPIISNTNIQASYSIKAFELFAGVENVFNFTQDDPIIAPELTRTQLFDATLVYANAFGRNIYGGIRINLNTEN